MWLVFGSTCHAVGFPGAPELAPGSWLTPLELPDSSTHFEQVPPFSSVLESSQTSWPKPAHPPRGVRNCLAGLEKMLSIGTGRAGCAGKASGAASWGLVRVEDGMDARFGDGFP